RRAAERLSASPSRPVPFLDAWDGLYVGWSFSLCGDRGRGAPLLETAKDYFQRHGLSPAAALAVWVQAEADLVAGDLDRARSVLFSPGGPHGPVLRPELLRAAGDLGLVLYPLLGARVLLERPTDLDRARAADLLAEAGSGLVGNRLGEWE